MAFNNSENYVLPVHAVAGENLVTGRKYRVESSGGRDHPFIGTLLDPGEQNDERKFNHILVSPLLGWRYDPREIITVPIMGTMFFETGESIALEKVTNYLGKRSMGQQIIEIKGKPISMNRVIPDNTVRIVESFFGTTARPRAHGPNRYITRIDNNNANNANNANNENNQNTNAEKAKKPRTRKNKRKSRKTNKSKKSRNSRKS